MINGRLGLVSLTEDSRIIDISLVLCSRQLCTYLRHWLAWALAGNWHKYQPSQDQTTIHISSKK